MALYVIDTSALIQIKDTVPTAGGRLWDTLTTMLDLVEGGILNFPSQVEAELSEHPSNDSISAWSARAKKVRQFGDPAYGTVKTIQLDSKVAKVCDWSRDLGDPADPYVIAQAVELRDEGFEVFVVTEDRRDKFDGKGKLKQTSVVTACAAVGVQTITAAEFLDVVDDAA